MTAVFWTVALAATMVHKTATGKTIVLPPETAVLPPGAGVELANDYCLTCHSADYPLTQPRGLSRDVWLGEVAKMQKVYGASIPADKFGAIADYLTKAMAK